ncbi:MAG TPA: hypothetical protein VJ505_01205 [Holophagaceae bacterium]|nr:hypothetical protein [Holophagaceae bacterium]
MTSSPWTYRFRIILHLLKRVSNPAGPERAEMDLAAPIRRRSCLGLTALEADERMLAEDWTGYEHSLFHLAARAVAALELHHHLSEDRPLPPETCWTWEVGVPDPSRRRLHASKAQAIAEAERCLEAGQSYRVGHIPVPALEAFLPSIEALMDHMQARVVREFPGHYMPWPCLDPAQREALARLFQSLFVAFLSEEVAPPAFGKLEDVELRQVPAPLGEARKLG